MDQWQLTTILLAGNRYHTYVHTYVCTLQVTPADVLITFILCDSSARMERECVQIQWSMGAMDHKILQVWQEVWWMGQDAYNIPDRWTQVVATITVHQKLSLLIYHNYIHTGDLYDQPYLISKQAQFVVWAIGPRATEDSMRNLVFFHTEYPRNGGYLPHLCIL